jgi:hypothetical protein
LPQKVKTFFAMTEQKKIKRKARSNAQNKKTKKQL